MLQFQSEPEPEQEQEPEPEPIMSNIQQDTQLSSLQNNDMSGAGFKVYGGSMQTGRSNNDKLRKFVSLNLR